MNVPKTNWFARYGVASLFLLAVALLTIGAVRRWHRPGHLDVITAQAMDMSEMRPPTGAAPVELATIRRGSIGDTVTYTGTVQAFNTQDISARIVGQVVSLPVYPADTVRAGQLLAQLDTAEAHAKTAQANAEASAADVGQRVAQLNHHQHHRAALEQAGAQIAVATAGVADADAEAQAADEGIQDARAAVQIAQANADYWKIEIAREKGLADAGAASQQEYQSELSQSQAAIASLAQAQAKLRQSQSMAASTRAKRRQAQKQVDAARAMQRMAAADLALAQEQEKQAELSATASRASARQAAIGEGYARITAPFDGIVTERAIASGTLVQSGTVLMKVAQIDRVRVQAHVAVSDLANIGRGTPVQIFPQAGGNVAAKPISGRVTAVFPAANEMSRTAVVEAVVPNPRHALLPGAFVTMAFAKSREKETTLLVPASALVYDGGKPFVWVARRDGDNGTAHSKTSADSEQYECAICHMRYSAADAKKHHFTDPMDGGKLTPVIKPAPSETVSTDANGATAHRVQVTVGANNSNTASISSSELSTGDRVVVRGQAGLIEGGSVVSTKWSDNGVETLPTVQAASSGVTRYRCETCNMTYSAADAKKNNYIDPMDGGKLTPVQGGSQ